MSERKRKLKENVVEKVVKKIKTEKNDKSENKDDRKKINKKKELVNVEAELDAEEEFDLGKVKHEKLADIEGIDTQISANLVRLFEQENTIPFIARYRKHMTNGMDAEKLRQVKESFEIITKVEAKAETLLKSLAKEGPVEPQLRKSIVAAKTLEEMKVICAPFKKGSKGTLAARARKEGLEDSALALLNGSEVVLPQNYVKSGLAEKDIAMGFQHIIADVVAKDGEILKLIDKLKQQERVTLNCSLKKDADKEIASKYELYKNFSQNIAFIKDHQMLAINRAEAQKVVSVKLEIPNSFWDKVRNACRERWLSTGKKYPEREKIVDKSVDDAIHRLLSPLVTRQIIGHLTKTAERSAINVFLANLKKLLLSPPLRGKTVLAIDPGISHGCKIAVVSPIGEPLKTGVVFLHDKKQKSQNMGTICKFVKTHKCETVAIGNGKYCRQTEEFISELINSGKFQPLDVAYTIINEQGVSHYSCSAAAAAEFPTMDPNLISAVSLARRLQDPLAELVKVEPRHLGVGMYQHDLPEKKLDAALDEVVSECVSFVGVDLNTASIHLLKRIAGLTNSRATAIANWRAKNGRFQSRKQLLDIKGIGSKTFRQCGGFVRILPSTARSGQREGNFNPLDQTEIHPEDYELTEKLLKKFEIRVDCVGSAAFVAEWDGKIKNFEALSREFNVPELQLKQISEALLKPADFDMRTVCETPLFRRGITTMESLQIDQHLSGVIRNVVPFGAFVDIGVGESGLIHCRYLHRDQSQWPQLGDKVNVIVQTLDIARKRIGLCLAK